MKYYILTSEQYQEHSNATDQQVIWTLDNTHCILEVENAHVIEEYVQVFNTGNEVNDWRFDTNTEEWRNWMTEQDYNGE